MSKHILDSSRPYEGAARIAQATRIERSQRPHPQSKELQQRPQNTDPATYARRFVEISRKDLPPGASHLR